jgi:hypothetical protein
MALFPPPFTVMPDAYEMEQISASARAAKRYGVSRDANHIPNNGGLHPITISCSERACQSTAVAFVWEDLLDAVRWFLSMLDLRLYLWLTYVVPSDVGDLTRQT